jgi:hypothetical protein
MIKEYLTYSLVYNNANTDNALSPEDRWLRLNSLLCNQENSYSMRQCFRINDLPNEKNPFNEKQLSKWQQYWESRIKTLSSGLNLYIDDFPVMKCESEVFGELWRLVMRLCSSEKIE